MATVETNGRTVGAQPAPCNPVTRLGRGAGRLYFALQAVAGILWWTLVPLSPWVRELTLGSLNPALVAAFDLPLFVGASALACLGIRWALWIVTPWTLLVTAVMMLVATVTGEAGWGALLMIASAVGTVAATLLIHFGRFPIELIAYGPFRFREARTASTRSHLATTALQIVVFWGLSLVAVPVVIVAVEWRWGLHVDLTIAASITGAVLLVAASALGIWSAVSMVRHGKGTPLPAAQAPELVVAGPYRLVRNPMAVAGIAQGVAVGMIANSWLVIAYALCGSLVWNWLIRPVEEADLTARFGAAYLDYQSRVRCWVPRFRLTVSRNEPNTRD